MSDELIELVAAEPRVARHFHLPLQSASNEILRRMQRRYLAEDFQSLVHRITRAIPDCGIGTDVICGFPGETDAHFQETFDCLAGLPITYLHPFTYSVRPGSTAQPMGDPVQGDTKKRRVRALKRLAADKNREFRQRLVGTEAQVLLETSRRSGMNHLTGWTDNYIRVSLPARNCVPSGLETVRVVGLSEDGLVGERCSIDVDFARA